MKSPVAGKLVLEGVPLQFAKLLPVKVHPGAVDLILKMLQRQVEAVEEEAVPEGGGGGGGRLAEVLLQIFAWY